MREITETGEGKQRWEEDERDKRDGRDRMIWSGMRGKRAITPENFKKREKWEICDLRHKKEEGGEKGARNKKDEKMRGEREMRNETDEVRYD